MTDKEHVPVAHFCLECAQKMIDSLPEGRSEHSAYCPHFNTLAQVTIEPTGVIRAWRLRGPLSEEQAAMMVEIAGEMKKQIAAKPRRTH